MGVAAAGCATAPPVTGPSTRDSAPAAEYGYRKSAPTAPIVSKGPKKRVAVVKFQDKSAYGRGRLGGAIQDILTTELARSGQIGKIHRATMIDPQFRTHSYYNSGAWRATWKLEGGGVMMNQSPHSLDIFVQLTGLPAKVRGKVDTRLHKIEVEEPMVDYLLDHWYEGRGRELRGCHARDLIEAIADTGTTEGAEALLGQVGCRFRRCCLP